MRSTIVTCLLASAGFFFASPTQADARDYFEIAQKTYKVEVEYWFFDTDYYYWRTMFETSSESDARFVYDLLVLAKENRQLNEAAPNEYWRYIPVDVRLVVEYHYPTYESIYPALKLKDSALARVRVNR